MAKTFLIVDAETNQTIHRMICGRIKQLYYDRNPKDHVGFVMANVVCLITTTGLFLGIAHVFVPFLKSPYAFAVIGCMTGAHIIYVGICCLIEKCQGSGKEDEHAKERKPLRDIPWLDPYGIARDAVDVPGKKTYFVVDAEKNTIVDIKHLGRWGQKRLNRRAKRQALKTDE